MLAAQRMDSLPQALSRPTYVHMHTGLQVGVVAAGSQPDAVSSAASSDAFIMTRSPFLAAGAVVFSTNLTAGVPVEALSLAGTPLIIMKRGWGTGMQACRHQA